MRLVLGEMWQGLRRNASMVVSVVLVTFVSLTFVGAAILLQMQIGAMKSYWFDRAQVEVNLCTSVSESANCAGGIATPEQKLAVEQALQGATLAPYVKEVTFESQDQAYATFLEQFKGDPIVEFVKPEYLNEKFWINMPDPSQSDVLIESLSGMPGVESVRDQRQYLEGIFSALNAASLTAVGIAGIMLVAAALLVATTIRLSAFSRRRELGIMRLVGASNRFIQAPFVLEGVVAALIGGVLASLALVGVAQFFVQGYLAPQMPFTSLVGVADALVVAPILLVLAALIAAISASIAIRRYLRV
ncbi:FtsX-like permease family protein [Pseudoclavibacter chungangensis]|uniref:Cell division protein FtsX n=1 Tax=Pseudoclavibacter chungangensis TaxID=587635 RepID=A0A7J5BPI8_9MICO|nr:permease-like cell division protein FtsX [Pseudoclavibacter chungangensis]KAB1655080.1 FtsX-like permease family protein [Pseudoclavibacter chungangensis]NYJ66156.1 cell division transport system permease protein [Pseudoclavibacter chungangensis]